MFGNNKKCKMEKHKINGVTHYKVIAPTSSCYDRDFSDEWDARMYAKEIDKLQKGKR